MRNSKAFKILAFIALFLLIIFSWVLWKDARDKKIRETPVNTGLQDPFGSGAGKNDLPSSGKGDQNSNGGGQNVPVTNTPVDNGVTIIEENPVLRHIYDKPVAGATFVVEERIIPESDSATPAEGLVEVYDFSGFKTVTFGMKSDDIIKIKTVLNRQTPSPSLTINNEYDTDMKNAVIDFQNKSGLPGDGVIGPNTYKKLNLLQGITGYTSVKKPNNIEMVLMSRFVDATTGLIYDKALRKNEEEKSVTKTSVPRVVEAMFDNTGQSIIMRYLKGDIIETYIARLTFPKIDPELSADEAPAPIASVSGDFLTEGISTISVSKDRKSFFYMNPTPTGVAGITYAFATKAKKQIFESPLVEWIADYATDAKISLTTKSSALVDGYSYTIDSKTGTMNKIMGGEKGLTTLMSPDGKKILYSTFESNTLKTFVKDLSTGKTNAISPSTLPEKCVWAKASDEVFCLAPVKAVTGTLPDDWYKGKVSFDDALWSTDMINFNGNIVYDFNTKSNQHLDGVNPMMDAGEDYLIFKNKKDGTLWGFDLSK